MSSVLLWKSQAQAAEPPSVDNQSDASAESVPALLEKKKNINVGDSLVVYVIRFSLLCLVITTFRLDSRWPSQTNIDIYLKGAVSISAEMQL